MRRTVMLGVVLIGFSPAPLLAESILIVPRRITATRTDVDWTRAENMIDGSGMNALNHQSGQSSQGRNMAGFWRTPSGELTAHIMLDLGAILPLEGVHLWNYNETGQTARGVKTLGLTVSADQKSWTQPQQVELPRATVNDAGTPLRLDSVIPARYVRLDLQSNHGDGNFTGLTELRAIVSLDELQRVSLAELDLTQATQSHGIAKPDRSISGSPLSIAGRSYPSGVGTHAPFALRIDLHRTGSRFAGRVGVDDYWPAAVDTLTRIPLADGHMRLTHEDASGEQFVGITARNGEGASGDVVFRVLGDGRELWSSGNMTRGQAAKPVDVDVRGVSVLTLAVDDGDSDVSGDYADWIDAEIFFVGTSPAAIDAFTEPGIPRVPIDPRVTAFLEALPAHQGRRRPATDWLIDDRGYPAAVSRGERPDEVVLSNGLVSRIIKLTPNAATLDIFDHATGRTLLRGIKPEAVLRIGGQNYNVGGLAGQPEYGYLDYEWLNQLELMPNPFVLTRIRTGPIVERMKWSPTRRHDNQVQWPPQGMELAMDYRCQAFPDVEVTVHYNLYDGIPLFCKWLTVIQGNHEALHLETYQSDLLALTEYTVTVNEGYGALEATPQTIILETDYAFGGSYQLSTKSHSIEYAEDPQYHSQVNYARTSRVLAISRPEHGTDVVLEKGQSLTSHRTWELITDSYERERRSLAQRRMYRTVAPWVTENPSVMHVRSAKESAVKNAIDQCAAVGFDSVILTFGSGADIEDMSPDNLNAMKRLADYAKTNGIEIGGYSLLASSWRGAEASVISPETGKTGGGVFGNAPCLDSDWGDRYFANLRSFFAHTGFTLFEHDGSYPGDRCASVEHHHRGAGDSQWTQFQVITDHYSWCLANDIYMNIPDWYFMNGGNKCAMHYREKNFTLPRQRHTLLARRDIFDGTWEKTPSMGWMHVPLVGYHGGSADSVFEPLTDNLDDYRFVLMQNFLLGVQGHYRGHRLFDNDETKAMVKGVVDFYNEHWDILNSDVVHFRRPNGRTIDGMLHVNPRLEEKACLVLFNSTGRSQRETVRVPLYYSGLTHQATSTDLDGHTQIRDLDRDYSVTVEVEMPPTSVAAYFFK